MTQERSSSDQLEAVAWKAFNSVRGMVETRESLLHLVGLFFIKFISDLALDRSYKKGGQAFRPAWRKLAIPPECEWGKLRLRGGRELGPYLDKMLEAVERVNPGMFSGISREVQFERSGASVVGAEETARLAEIVSQADLRPSSLKSPDDPGDFFERLLRLIFERQGRQGGEIYIPSTLAQLLAEVLAPSRREVILDPFCGSGLLLSTLARQAGAEGSRVVGQDPRIGAVSLCKMSLFFRGVAEARIEASDSLRNPLHGRSGKLVTADVVVCNPPFNWRNWGGRNLLESRPELARYPLNPRGGSEYAFLFHMLEVARKQTSRIGIVVPPGVLFRQDEVESRRFLVQENLLSVVMALPPNLFRVTTIPVAILVLENDRKDDKVLFVDASQCYESSPPLNRIPDSEVKRIAEIILSRATVSGFSRRVSAEEIRELGFNLNVSRFVQSGGMKSERQSFTDLVTQSRVLKEELEKVSKEVDDFLGSLGVLN